jgi:hypothetical protein
MAIESWIQLREGLHVAAADGVCCGGDAQAVNQGHVRWEGGGGEGSSGLGDEACCSH